MTLVDNYFPFDAGAGQTATLTRWRSMGRLFCGSGVIPSYTSQFACTISAGVVTVQPGAAWVDGFYGEVTVNKTISVSGTGMIVAQMDPVNKYVRVVFNAGQTTPSQSPTGVFEIPLYTVSGGVLTDVRQFALPDPNKVAKLRVYRSVTYNTSPAWTSYGFDQPSPYPSGWNGLLYTCPYAADYMVISQVGFTSSAVGQYYNAQIMHNGAVTVWAGTTNASAVSAVMVARVEDIVTCKAGDTLGIQHLCSAAIVGGGMFGTTRAYLSIRAMS